MFLSVITPTFNRADTLHRCYESLCKQDFHDFEWIVIDDGSTDETAERVLAWQAEAPFSILYAKKPNGGKPSAVNRGVALAKGEMCVILDSDDAVADQGLQHLVSAWCSLTPGVREKYWCVVALCEDSLTNTIVGDSFPAESMTSSVGELLYKYKLSGEKWGLMRTDLLKLNPYPEGAGFRFVPESLIWNRLGRDYQYLSLNKVVRTYYLPTGAALGNLSGRANSIRNAAGFLQADIETLNMDFPTWFLSAPMFFMKRAAQLSRYGLHSKLLGKSIGALNGRLARLLVLATFPLGLAVYVRDKLWFRYVYTKVKSKQLKETIA